MQFGYFGEKKLVARVGNRTPDLAARSLVTVSTELPGCPLCKLISVFWEGGGFIISDCGSRAAVFSALTYIDGN
jgi:hypothetical protein